MSQHNYLTPANLATALIEKGALYERFTAVGLGDAIKTHALEAVIVQGTRPPLNFEKAFAVVFGEPLTKRRAK